MEGAIRGEWPGQRSLSGDALNQTSVCCLSDSFIMSGARKKSAFALVLAGSLGAFWNVLFEAMRSIAISDALP